MGIFNILFDTILDKIADKELGLDTPQIKKIEWEFEQSTAYPIKVAGIQYENRREIIKRMTQNTPICLQRDSINPYDTNAIAIYEKETNQQIGYLPKANNTSIAKAMDSGLAVYAGIYKIEHGIKQNSNCQVSLIIAFHPNHILDKISEENKRIKVVKETPNTKIIYSTSSASNDKDYNWDDSGSIWDDYDEDGIPYEDYDN